LLAICHPLQLALVCADTTEAETTGSHSYMTLVQANKTEKLHRASLDDITMTLVYLCSCWCNDTKLV